MIGNIEIHLNRLRLNYLRAIALSPELHAAPARAISADFNKAFQSLAGLRVRQATDRPRRDNDAFWLERGFSQAAKHELPWEPETQALQSSLQKLAGQITGNATKLYAELIALKPGFHEAWLHDDFPEDAYEGPDSPRGRVFAVLRSRASDLIPLGGTLPRDILTPGAYQGYAPCAFTEGPLVQRRHPDISYYGSLRGVGHLPSQTKRRSCLLEDFHVIDIWQRLNDDNTPRNLERIIAEVESSGMIAIPDELP